MVSINARQNDAANLDLLAAQRYVYSQAKRFQLVRLLAAVVVGAAAPPVVAVAPRLATPVAVIGAMALALDLGLKWLESTKLQRAAKMQEQFDTTVFDLPWNDVALGERVTPELIAEGRRRFTGSRTSLRDWYPEVDRMPWPLDVLFCQRANLVWDWRLRQAYAWALGLAVLGLLGWGLLVGLVAQETLGFYLLAVVIPSLAAIAEGVDVVREHVELVREKQAKEGLVTALWRTALGNPTAVTIPELRQVQDCIYHMRAGGPLVPDFWYRLRRAKYEADMRATAAMWQAEVSAHHP